MPWSRLEADHRLGLGFRPDCGEIALDDFNAASEAAFGNLPMQHRCRQADPLGLLETNSQELLIGIKLARHRPSRAIAIAALALQHRPDGVTREPRRPGNLADALPLFVQH